MWKALGEEGFDGGEPIEDREGVGIGEADIGCVVEYGGKVGEERRGLGVEVALVEVVADEV